MPDNITFPIIAVEDDGRIHLLENEHGLSEIPELFVHGEITLVMDLHGTSYEYVSGDFSDYELHPVGQGDTNLLTDAVWSRVRQLAKESTRKRNQLIAKSLDPTLLEALRGLPPSELGRAFLLASLLQLD